MSQYDPVELARQVAMFRSFDDEQLLQVGSLLQEQRYQKGQTIFLQDETGGCLYLIITGRVRIYLSAPNGSEATLRIYGAGSYFGELSVLDSSPRSASASALNDVVCAVLYRDDFLRLLSTNFSLVQQVLAVLTERLRYTTTYSEHLIFLNTSQRVAAMLLQLIATEEPLDDQPRLKITQHDLASLACTTRESVNHALREFANQGLIHLERGAITVLNQAGLHQQLP